MSAYFIAQIDIHDPDEYRNYLEGFMPIFERYSGRLLVSSSKKPKVVEGSWSLSRIVLMEFPDQEHAQNWLNDAEYQRLAHYRHQSAQTNLVLVDGIV
ncbi:MAG: DUF1330 domain-containing protein [Boseongicola sp.]|nr:MAG: DUF1330 domain-containing protein [Boseongicola sp.]